MIKNEYIQVAISNLKHTLWEVQHRRIVYDEQEGMTTEQNIKNTLENLNVALWGLRKAKEKGLIQVEEKPKGRKKKDYIVTYTAKNLKVWQIQVSAYNQGEAKAIVREKHQSDIKRIESVKNA